MISDDKLNEFKEILLSSHRPLFLFDDDPDGLASFLVLYKFVNCGAGWPIKGSIIDEHLVEKVNNYCADLIIVLDKADIEQEFIDGVKTKVLWLDHHKPVERKKVFYINPQIQDLDDDTATSYWAYKIAKKNLWIAAVGIISDWQMLPKDIQNEFYENYEKLLSKKIKTPEQALFKQEIGKLSKIFSFNLKGKSDQISSSIKILSRIEDPFDLLEGKTAQSKVVIKRYETHLKNYEKILNSVDVSDDKLILFKYYGNENSYTTDLANELLFKYPNKVIIVARESNHSFKCSLRSGKLRIDNILEKVLNSVNGVGGGHSHACGAVINSDQFDLFIDLFKQELK